MKINTFATEQLKDLLMGCLTESEVDVIADGCGYSASHGLNMIRGNFPINTDKGKDFITKAFQFAIKKANEQGKSLARYVNDNKFCYYQQQKTAHI